MDPVAVIWLLLVACRPDGSSIFTPGDDSPLAFEEIQAEGDWRAVTDLQFVPGTDEFLLLDKSGRVGRLRLESDEAVLLGEFTAPDVHDDLDCGLLSVAVDPSFADNGRFWLGQCTSETHLRVDRYTWSGSSTASTRVALLEVGDDRAERPWHNVGSMVAAEDGSLWILLGDKTVRSNAGDLTTPLGSLLRVIPDVDGSYAPHPDNPFVDSLTRDPAIYAYGLRSPWRGSLDEHGRFWVGDVGANDVEEVNVITGPGQDLGWPVHEGPCVESCDDVDPVAWWRHDGVDDYQADDARLRPTINRVAWAGPTYSGAEDRYDALLTGRTLFGDYCLGFVRALEIDAEGAVVHDAHLGHLEFPVSVAEGPDGYLYAATFGACETADLNRPPRSTLVRAVLNR